MQRVYTHLFFCGSQYAESIHTPFFMVASMQRVCAHLFFLLPYMSARRATGPENSDMVNSMMNRVFVHGSYNEQNNDQKWSIV